jgi:hypothetical protein
MSPFFFKNYDECEPSAAFGERIIAVPRARRLHLPAEVLVQTLEKSGALP